MSHPHRIVQPGRTVGTVLSETGTPLALPADWAFLAAGDAAVTRAVKGLGETWGVQVRMGKRLISKGIWAKKTHIQAAVEAVAAKRADPAYERRRQQELARRAAKQQAYVADFATAVVDFLHFHPRYGEEACRLGEIIAAHATPVGSGTVARTERLPLARRAEAAVIAWMRHQTTAYDAMRIPRLKGRRREVRRQLAGQSVAVLQPYRQGLEVGPQCALQRALAQYLADLGGE